MPLKVGILASDITGQHQRKVDGLPMDSTVGELVERLVPEMKLPRKDAGGRPLNYQIRLEREGRHLNRAERVGDVLREQDHVTLQSNIDAGAR